MAIPLPSLDIGLRAAETPGDVAVTLQILLLLTVLSLAPAIIILMTSFTRTVIVLSFIRNALGDQPGSAQSSLDWTCFVLNRFYYGTCLRFSLQ